AYSYACGGCWAAPGEAPEAQPLANALRGVVGEVRGNFFAAGPAPARAEQAGPRQERSAATSRTGAIARGGGAVVAILGLLVAACQSPAARHGQAAAVPPARITITTGNLTFSSPAGAAAHRGSVRSEE